MVASPTADSRVYEWLMNSPHPPRHFTAQKPRNEQCPKFEVCTQSSSMICEVAAEDEQETKTSELASLANNNQPSTVYDGNNKISYSVFADNNDDHFDFHEEREEEDEACVTSTSPINLVASAWQDILVLSLCAIHWVAIMSLVCILGGLVIVAKTGYRLGLRHRARKPF